MPVVLGYKRARAALNYQHVSQHIFGLCQLTLTQIIPRHSRGFLMNQGSFPMSSAGTATLVLGQRTWLYRLASGQRAILLPLLNPV